MKKLSIVAVFLICTTLFSSVAFAWTVDKVDWDSVEVEAIENNDVHCETEDNNTPSEWAVEEVIKANEYEILPQLTDSPGFQDAITREQFAELVVCMLENRLGGGFEVSDTVFSDCTNTQVLKAYAVGVVDGVGDNLFNPKSTTNREQIATMLYRALNLLESRLAKDVTPAEADISAFADCTEVSTWAQEGVGVLAANGLMRGTSETTLSPKDPCTVEQSIALVTRIFELV